MDYYQAVESGTASGRLDFSKADFFTAINNLQSVVRSRIKHSYKPNLTYKLMSPKIGFLFVICELLLV